MTDQATEDRELVKLSAAYGAARRALEAQELKHAEIRDQLRESDERVVQLHNDAAVAQRALLAHIHQEPHPATGLTAFS
ncbi:MAG: hypothetical protein ACREO0_08840 [Pseudoxanthomonas sp.]